MKGWQIGPYSEAPLKRADSPSLMLTLRVLTPDVEASQRAVNAPVSVIRCSGGYRCRCKPCEAERAFLVRTGSRDRIQPWQKKAA